MSSENSFLNRCLSQAEVDGWRRGDLPPELRQPLEAHIRRCATCAAKVGQNSSAAEHTIGDQEASSLVEIELASHSGSHWTDGSVVGEVVTESAGLGTQISLGDFLSGLSQSGLLGSSDLAAVREKSAQDPAAGTVQGLVAWLVQQSKLTPYQAEILSRGQKAGLVVGNYVILEKLGQGGMGAVFKARHRRMNRLVALKVLPNSMSSIAEAIARFQREVEAAARLHHPNIAAAYDADEAAGVHFLVMEYVEGPNLSSHVKAHGPLPVQTAVRLMEQAARGLAAAHAQGVVHRDIKPSNMMVNREGLLKILDMGLAQMRGGDTNLELTSDVTQTGRVMGTVDYMAPEQARDAKSVDARADIYSLGCTFYFLATGKTLAPGSSAAEKLLWHQTQIPPPISELAAPSSPRLDALLLKMMEKKPADRPQNMLDVADEFAACLQELPPAEYDGLPSFVTGDSDSRHAPIPYAQATRLGAHGDTVLSSPHGATVIQKLPGASRNSRWLVAASGIAGALVLGLILAAPYFSSRPVEAETASLLVDVPEGPAEVLVNSQWRGRAGEAAGKPLELQVKPGKYFVQVRREGYEPFEATVEALPGQPARVAATLRRAERLPPPTPQPSPHLPYEKLLAWVFSNHGRITAVTGAGVQHQFVALSALPAEAIEILGIKLDGTGISDSDLKLLSAVPGLRELSLADTRITDEGLAHLAALRQLNHLNLAKTPISNAGLTHLSRLSELTELNLEQTSIGDAGLARLNSLPRLERLFLSDTRVTDVGLAQLKSLPALKSLSVHGTGLSDATYAVLKADRPQLEIAWDGADVERSLALRLLEKRATLAVVDRAGQRHEGLQSAPQLPFGRVSVREVNLSTGGNYSDEDLQQLALLPEVERLSLAGVEIREDGLRRLHGLSSLKSLDLGTPRLAPTAVAALRAALPACEVVLREPADVEVARLVCQAGGRVNIFTERGQSITELKDIKELPQGSYTVRAIFLDGLQEVDSQLFEKLPQLRELAQVFAANTGLGDDFVLKLAQCKSVEELTLSGTRISPAAAAHLKQLPKLSRLFVAKTDLGGEGVRQLGSLPQLTHLSLMEVQLADDDLSPLKRLERLEWLDLSHTPISDAALAHLGRLSKLREVNITGCAISDAGQEELTAAIAKCRVIGSPLSQERLAARWLREHSATVGLETGRLASVKDLPRNACRVLSIDLEGLGQLRREELVQRLAACPNVVSLNLSKSSLQESDLAFLRRMPDLRELRLGSLAISDQALAWLSQATALEVLDLGATRVTGQQLAKLAQAKELKQLLLANTLVDDRHFAALTQFDKLEVLDVSAAGNITDAGLAELSKLPRLTSLGLRRAKITDAGLEKLVVLTDLVSLELEGTKVSDAGVARLAGLPKLRHIGLSNTQVTDGVAATLGGMKQLRSINLTRTRIGPETIRQLQTELPGCTIAAPTFTPREPTPGTASFDGGAGTGGIRAGRGP